MVILLSPSQVRLLGGWLSFFGQGNVKVAFGDPNFIFGCMFRSNPKKFWVGKVLGFFLSL
jgi:hypothetical protein